MITIRKFVLVVFTAAILMAPEVVDAKPRYLILRTPTAPTKAQPTRQHYSGYKTVVTGEAYSYGYFGAAPRRHASRHTGYYNNYIQWGSR